LKVIKAIIIIIHINMCMCVCRRMSLWMYPCTWWYMAEICSGTAVGVREAVAAVGSGKAGGRQWPGCAVGGRADSSI